MNIAAMEQMDRPEHLRYKRPGIHDHHRNALRPGETPPQGHEDKPSSLWPCFDDERCWWNGGSSQEPTSLGRLKGHYSGPPGDDE